MLSYPLDLSFKIVTIGTRIRIKDAAGRQAAYVRKQKFKLKENVGVYADEAQSKLLFRMRPTGCWTSAPGTRSVVPTATLSGPWDVVE